MNAGWVDHQTPPMDNEMADCLAANPPYGLQSHLARQMKLLQAWIELHQDELMADWHLASTGQTPFKIDPLR